MKICLKCREGKQGNSLGLALGVLVEQSRYLPRLAGVGVGMGLEGPRF